MIRNLSVRRTLVLGLGSTGLQVCEQLAEQLNWQFGSFQRASWVRLLVVETAQPQSILGDRVLWVGMRREEYLPYLSSPRPTGAEFGFYEWQDAPTLGDIDNPADGAGNCRMLGRLCLLHSRNYSNLQRRMTDDISYLQGLTEQRVADALDEPGLDVSLHTETVVYVVGTLCGGTGSGAAADLGYLVDVWSNQAVRRQAIFTLPHPTCAGTLARRYKKNAFYALKELNHYMLRDVSWTQRLPGSETPYMSRAKPYDILRILMPNGGSGSDVKSLNAMIAQYLAAAVGPAGSEIAASDVDANNKLTGGEPIGFMRPNFSTMGVAALEYPGEHIQRAATSRLLSSALRLWCGSSNDSPGVARACALLGSGDFDAFLRRLTQGAEAGSLARLPKPAPDGTPPRAEEVRQLLREIDSRLTASQPPEGDDGAPTLIQKMQTNQTRILEELGARVDRMLDEILFALDGGPGVAASALRLFQKEIESWSAAGERILPEARQDASSQRTMLDKDLEALEKVEKSALVWNRKQKLIQAWAPVAEQLRSYLAIELKTHAISHLQRREMVREAGDQLKKVTAQLLLRLDQMQAAFQQEAAELERRWKELAGLSPSVNGKAYFEAEPPAAPGTVTQEYFKLLRQRRWADEPATGWSEDEKEAAAMREVISALKPLRAELTRGDDQSAFDSRPGIQSARDMIPPTVMSAAEATARGFFTPLREQVHIAEKASDSDVDAVLQASEPKLKVSAAQVSDALAGVKGAQWLDSNLAFMDIDSNDSRPSVTRVRQRVRNGMPLRRPDVIDSNDPYRLLIIREQHGFTLGQMEGVVRRHRYDNDALQAAEDCTDFKFWHTRRDVDWVDPLVPPGQVDSTEEAWLLAVLLGRPADTALPDIPSSRGEIDREGWYQLVAGEFFVYFAPNLETSARGARLPLAFQTAVAKLLSPDFALLRQTLTMRLSSYVDSQGPERLVRAVDQALRGLVVFGIGELDAGQAERIVRRYYRRNDSLTRAFFDFRTENLKNPAEFAHLKRLQGTPIEDRAGEVYPADGYYCPACHNLLGGSIDQLREAMFLCPRCSTGDRAQRYWP